MKIKFDGYRHRVLKFEDFNTYRKMEGEAGKIITIMQNYLGCVLYWESLMLLHMQLTSMAVKAIGSKGERFELTTTNFGVKHALWCGEMTLYMKCDEGVEPIASMEYSEVKSICIMDDEGNMGLKPFIVEVEAEEEKGGKR